jgi:hypothetical protein
MANLTVPHQSISDDIALAQACAGGSSEAWETFVRRYREPLYCFIRSKTRGSYYFDLHDNSCLETD